MSINSLTRREEIQEILRKHKPMRCCLSCDVEPRLGYQAGQYDGVMKMPMMYPKGAYYELFTLFCPECGYRSGPTMDLQAVVTDWHRANTGNDEHYAQCWSISFDAQVLNNKPEAA